MQEKGEKEREKKEIIKRKRKERNKEIWEGIDNFIRKLDRFTLKRVSMMKEKKKQYTIFYENYIPTLFSCFLLFIRLSESDLENDAEHLTLTM